ncbi:hypothetical protein ACFLY2_00400 [Patescibacteria group bacterium]
MRRSYTINFPHFYNVKNALAHQNNAIEASAIERIIGRNKEKARVFWRKFRKKKTKIFFLVFKTIIYLIIKLFLIIDSANQGYFSCAFLIIQKGLFIFSINFFNTLSFLNSYNISENGIL